MEALIENALAAAIRLGMKVHIRNCAAGVLFRAEVAGAVTTLKPRDVIAALDRFGTARVTMSRTASRKLAKWALKWGGPNRRELAKKIRCTPIRNGPLAFGGFITRQAAKTLNFMDYGELEGRIRNLHQAAHDVGDIIW